MPKTKRQWLLIIVVSMTTCCIRAKQATHAGKIESKNFNEVCYNMTMNKYIARTTRSARGELFNPLIYPFLLATSAYGLGFGFLTNTAGVHESSLFMAMTSIGASVPVIWGIIAVLIIIVGFTFLLFNLPPAGKLSGLAGFMLWVFATFCWGLTGGWLLIFAIGVPNMWFWFWQYLSLARFRQEDIVDDKRLEDGRSKLKFSKGSK